jgi:hypothetical protein
MMAEFDNLPNDYDDERAHRLCNRPHDALAGWAVVAFVLLVAVVGFGVERVGAMRCTGAAVQGCVIGAIAGSVAPAAQAGSVSLADEIGIAPRQRQ